MKRIRPSGSGGRFRLTLLLATVAAFILVPVASAFASEEHPYIAGNSIIDQLPESSARGVVTDSNGDKYVTNSKEKKVLVYSATGATLITEFTVAMTNGPNSLAVDSAGALYVQEYNGQVDKYKPSEFPVTATTTYALEETAGNKGVIVAKTGAAHAIAVDPANNDLYVAASTHVSSYEPSGKLISATIGEGLVTEPSYFGVDVYGANGDVYVTDIKHARVYVLNAAGTAIVKEISGSGSPAGVFEAPDIYTLAVDQSSGDFYVYYAKSSNEAATSAVYEFNASGGYLSQIGNKFDSEALALSDFEPADVAVDNGSSSPNKGDVYVTSKDQPNLKDSVYAFGPLPPIDLTVKVEGSGAGEITSKGTFAELEGSPPIECSYASPGPATGTCKDETTYSTVEEDEGIALKANPAAGSEIVEWRLEKGNGHFTLDCNPTEIRSCLYEALGEKSLSGEQSEIVAVFNVKAAPKDKLKVNTNGSGSVKCNATTCEPEYTEGTSIELAATGATHNAFTGWSPVSGSASACALVTPCTFTIKETSEVTANFEEEAPVAGVPVIEGTAREGHELTANPEPSTWGYAETFTYEWEDCVGITCTPIASGSKYTLTPADVGKEVQVTVTASNKGSHKTTATARTAVVERAPTESRDSPEVYGEVPETTTLNSTACDAGQEGKGQYLGEFVPGVAERYHHTCTVEVTATGAENTLTATDEYGKAHGHEGFLEQPESENLNKHKEGPYWLARALEIKTEDTQKVLNEEKEEDLVYTVNNSALEKLKTPRPLVSYSTPVSLNPVTLEFSQQIEKTDPLHTGKYGKVITLTLLQTQP